MKKTLKSQDYLGINKINFLELPNTNFFRFEIVSELGADVERVFEQKFNKDVYGLSHFCEHLAFKSPQDYGTEEFNSILKNKGTYNASTDFDRINYWFSTTCNNIDLGLRVTMNMAFNDFSKINQNEFDSEKKVVVNEIKRYNDDHQNMFYFGINSVMHNLKSHDNILGNAEVIDNITLQDAKDLRNILLTESKYFFNFTYDPAIITKDELMVLFEKELSRYQVYFKQYTDYRTPVDQVIDNKYVVSNESKQSMTTLIMPVDGFSMDLTVAVQYLSHYAKDISLSDIIREKNGLTYGIHLYTDIKYGKDNLYFGCDVSKGTEDKLLECFNESINLVADQFNEEAFDKVIDAFTLKDIMSRLNQKQYLNIFDTIRQYPEYFKTLQQDAEEDLDNMFNAVIKKVTFERVQGILKDIKSVIKEKEYIMITNY